MPYEHRWPTGKQTTNMDEETRERLLKLPGFVILGKEAGANAYTLGYVENSFSMQVKPAQTNFWWVGTARSNFGSTHELTTERVRKTVDEHCKDLNKSHPGTEFTVWDVRDPEIPVEFDWETWLWGSQRSDKTLSGVVEKYAARNLHFRMKEDPEKTITEG